MLVSLGSLHVADHLVARRQNGPTCLTILSRCIFLIESPKSQKKKRHLQTGGIHRRPQGTTQQMPNNGICRLEAFTCVRKEQRNKCQTTASADWRHSQASTRNSATNAKQRHLQTGGIHWRPQGTTQLMPNSHLFYFIDVVNLSFKVSNSRIFVAG